MAEYQEYDTAGDFGLRFVPGDHGWFCEVRIIPFSPGPEVGDRVLLTPAMDSYLSAHEYVMDFIDDLRATRAAAERV